jgi:photosystem II stability/assembly factor-like uncharacterized protein
MKKLLNAYLLFSFFSINSLVHAQVSNSNNFKEISREMNAYYDRVGKDKAGYKQFKRWEWYTSTRTGPGGELVDHARLNLQAYRASSVERRTLAERTLANTGSWRSVGPGAVNSDNRGIGRVNRIAFHPTNGNIMYIATAGGGLWITTDNGSNWYSYTEGIPNINLTGVAVHPTNSNILYILTGDGDAGGMSGTNGLFFSKNSTGILKSFDGGFTWFHTSLHWEESDGIIAYKLVMHPTNPEILMVATNAGIFRSTDGGNTWTNDLTDLDVFDIEFQPGNSSVVYICGNRASQSRIFKSITSGQSFTETHSIAFVGTGLNRTALAVSAASPNNVFWFCGPASAVGSFRGFYRSTDIGESFTLRTNTPNLFGRSAFGNDNDDQSGYDIAVAVNPSDANIITTGGIRVWTSSNAGSSFSYQDNYVSTSSYYHDDIHDLVYHPLRPTELYMCADGGVYRSTDNGNNWIAINNNLQVTQYYEFSINPNTGFGAENVMIGGTQDNGTNKRESSGSNVFTQILGADGMDCFIDPDGASTYVASIQNGKFYYSPNSGSSFETVGDETTVETALDINVGSRWVTPVAEITGGTSQFVIGYQPVILVTRVVAGSFAFSNIGSGQISGRTFIKTARGNANRIYAGDNDWGGANRIMTTTNMGSSWTEILYDASNAIPITDLAFNADNGNELWVTYGGYGSKKVEYSNNGGDTWTDISGSLPRVPINCIVFDDNNGSPAGAVYIGTDIGVFYRDHTLGDWVPFSNALPVVEVTDLEIHEADGTLRAATYGRGIWETSLYSVCPFSRLLSTANTSYARPYYFQVSNDISSEAWHFGSGTNVFYKAGVEIVLTPGFHAQGATDNVFEAAIGPCGGGVPTTAPLRATQPVPLKGFLVR